MHSLKELEERIKECRKCRLWKSRKNPVAGEGSEKARIMFVGEAPGKNEDEQGRPFVGKAGQFLNKTLNENGIERSSVYITNVVKCRPPNNRDPLPDEINACSPYLEMQIEIIKPEIIVALGRFASYFILSLYGFKPRPISEIHGKIFSSPINGIKIIPMYHPAACIYNPALKNVFRKEIAMLAKL
ncbi:MAG: uracil-DNA glycosylase [Thermoplasmata archaeon]|nr:uracil-DNA glycosylase [Thermoplasmata archaeon]